MKEVTEHKFDNEDALYQVLNLIFYAMVGFPLMVFLYLYLEIKDGNFVVVVPDPDLHQILLWIIPVFCLINVVLSYTFYHRLIKATLPAEPLRQKLQKFYKASLIKYSFLEIATALSLIGLFLTGEMLYVVIYLIVLMIFSLNRPTPYRLRKDMKIKAYPPSRDKNRNPL